MLTSHETAPSYATLNAILGRIATPIWIFDIDQKCVSWANTAGCQMWKAETVDELRARDFTADMSITVATRLRQYQQEFECRDVTFSEVWTYYPKGVPSTIRVKYSGIKLPDGRMAMLCEGGEEFDETPDKLRSAEALMHTSVMINLYGEDGVILYSNPAATTIRPAYAGTLDAHFVRTTDFDLLCSNLDDCGEAQIVAEVYTAQGTRWHEITARHCKDPVTGKPACLSSEVDVSGIKQTEAQARYDACHDLLTGLPNRAYVQMVFEQRLKESLTRSCEIAFLFVDLDRFKTINDSLGHGIGDQVLVEVARRLTRIVGSQGDIARLNGDEFLVLLELTPGARDIEKIGRDLLRAMDMPIVLGEQSLRITFSVGVSIAPIDGKDITTLLKNADAAMYKAKTVGGNHVMNFTAAMGFDALARMQMEIDLRGDFEKRALQLYYQPRVSVSTGRIVSAEVLLRWPHASGYVPPDIFVPLAEENGLIVQIGAWVLHEAARQQVAWKRAGYPITLSVNVSPRQLAEGNFLQVAHDALAQTGCDPTQLELEITERLLLDDQPYIARALDDLRKVGFGISIDDFGIGYSNLAELHRHPIDCLKIDRSFISSLDKQGPIMDLIINMGRMLKVRVVVEGVETEEQLAWLRERHCDEYQGYHYSRPVPAKAFQAMLQEQKASTSNL